MVNDTSSFKTSINHTVMAYFDVSAGLSTFACSHSNTLTKQPDQTSEIVYAPSERDIHAVKDGSISLT